jgi:hypothetical protein
MQIVKIEIKKFAKFQHAKLINSLDENALTARRKRRTVYVGGKARVEKSAANAGNGLFLARDDH